LYEPILKAFPDNANLQAKLGICYLKVDGKKAEALKLLKSASGNVATEKKEYTETGDKASPDTYLILPRHITLMTVLIKHFQLIMT